MSSHSKRINTQVKNKINNKQIATSITHPPIRTFPDTIRPSITSIHTVDIPHISLKKLHALTKEGVVSGHNPAINQTKHCRHDVYLSIPYHQKYTTTPPRITAFKK